MRVKERIRMEEERLQAAIYRAIDSLNTQLPPGVKLDKSMQAPLYGPSSKLESLDFVTFIMEVEEKVNEEFGADITIADENLLSKEKSPFATVRTLNDYLADLLEHDPSMTRAE
jgi:acyl carrier protein